METIQYSLKKNSTYSIDLKSSIYTTLSSNEGKVQIPNKMLLNKTSTKLNNIFDKHCLETYGNKTCILFELDDDTIEIRLLDKLYQLKLYQLKYTGKNKLYIVIPSLLEKLYTVVLVKMIQKTNAKEIVAIHFPSN
jgi:hypothetical protein